MTKSADLSRGASVSVNFAFAASQVRDLYPDAVSQVDLSLMGLTQ